MGYASGLSSTKFALVSSTMCGSYVSSCKGLSVIRLVTSHISMRAKGLPTSKTPDTAAITTWNKSQEASHSIRTMDRIAALAKHLEPASEGRVSCSLQKRSQQFLYGLEKALNLNKCLLLLSITAKDSRLFGWECPSTTAIPTFLTQQNDLISDVFAVYGILGKVYNSPVHHILKALSGI